MVLPFLVFVKENFYRFNYLTMEMQYVIIN